MRRLAYLLVSITITYACECGPSSYYTFEEEFCKRDYVTHAKVLDKSDFYVYGHPGFKYAIEYITIYKMPKALSELANTLYSLSPSEDCGLELDPGKEYLLSGVIVLDGEVQLLTPCEAEVGLLKQWDQVSAAEEYKLSTLECVDQLT
ncbi:unnamed protein product [Cylicocyclus nassatus]|uniref:NTR domain-containing protein n=1 Tax=Cylicocyclus nassatus TaxID=53992 RepID=A0AA36GY50_CYLNA|nr:unnamed protein product [Cylicocyclus nassatus]